jgi:hypothetical protein
MQRGARLYQQRDLAGALQAFEAALAIQPDLSPARFNIAVICRDLERNDTARALFEQLIAAGEITAESFNNLGVLAMRDERFDEAVGYFQQAIAGQPDFPLARFNLGTLLLRMGHWEEGWREYEWRWQTPTFTPLRCPQPQWRGDPLDGTLLLHTEQGIGDVFQFARFIPLIRQRCRHLILVRPDHLECMFSPPQWADDVMSAGEIPLGAFDAVLPLMSAPLALGIRFEDLPCGCNYLTPQPRRVELGPVHVPGARLRIGIAWCGSPTHVNDAFRSTGLESFAPLLQLPGLAFYSLQLQPRGQDACSLQRYAGVLRDLRGLQRDFADTAAIVRQLDLVISVDTSILHLCGGLGLPVWGLISRRADWRWLGDARSDTPWYPTMKLFRQRRLNDWAELMQRVAAELRTLQA